MLREFWRGNERGNHVFPVMSKIILGANQQLSQSGRWVSEFYEVSIVSVDIDIPYEFHVGDIKTVMVLEPVLLVTHSCCLSGSKQICLREKKKEKTHPGMIPKVNKSTRYAAATNFEHRMTDRTDHHPLFILENHRSASNCTVPNFLFHPPTKPWFLGCFFPKISRRRCS